MRALVVDDSRAMRGILRRILGDVGFGEILEAENGRHALEQLHANDRPDVVLVDWHMPEMNGLEFVQTVRAEAVYASLPLMMVTSETDLSRVEAALLAGANDYIMKPFTRDAIVKKLKQMGLAVGAAA